MEVDEARPMRTEEQLRELLAHNGRFYPPEAPLLLHIRDELDRAVAARQSHWTQGEKLKSVTFKVRSAEQRLDKAGAAMAACSERLQKMVAEHAAAKLAMEAELSQKARARDDRHRELDALKEQAARIAATMSEAPAATATTSPTTVEAIEAEMANLAARKAALQAQALHAAQPPPPPVIVISAEQSEQEEQGHATPPLYGKADPAGKSPARVSPYPEKETYPEVSDPAPGIWPPEALTPMPAVPALPLHGAASGSSSRGCSQVSPPPGKE